MLKFEVINVGQFDDEVIKESHSDGTESWIPKDLTNSDYQRYLRWLENPDAEEGGTL